MNSLTLFSVCKKFSYYDQDRTLFWDLNYTFDQAKTYAIMGPSGCGKSTLLHIMAGIDYPTKGTVYLNHTPLNRLQEAQRGQTLSLVLQSSHFINELTVHENAALAGLVSCSDTGKCFDTSRELLRQVGLSDYLSYPVGVLSGGQRQRLALVCALMNKPAFLIADEPTGNLDNSTAHLIMELLVALHKDYKCGIILTTHDPTIAAHMDIVLYLKPTMLVAVDKYSLTQEIVS